MPNLRSSLRVFTILMLTLLALPALSHDSRPIYVEITEQSANHYRVSWKAPVSLPAFALPTIVMPESCAPASQSVSGQSGDAYTFRGHFICEEGLSGSTLALQFPNNNPSLSTLARITLLSGASYSHIFAPDELSWQIPAADSLWQIAQQYTLYGIEHIFAGIDHLLFIACLVFIARTGKRILLTVTGFTLAHSLTLALATLGIVTPPVPPVEASIALSIVFLAHEIAVGNPASWTWRFPVLVSSSFGLLHGFGFASVLRDLGLPQTDLTPALLFFNVGVEVGQLLFIGILVAILMSTAKLVRISHQRLLDSRFVSLSGSYVIGTLASLWLFQRLAGFV